MSSATDAARALAELARAVRPGEPIRFELGTVNSASPLTVILDRSSGVAIGPITASGGVAPAEGDRVLLVWVPDVQAYVCLGTVTAP